MREPRAGLPWSRGRVATRARYGTYMGSAAWFARRQRWLEEYRDLHNGNEPNCVVCDQPWTLRHGDLHHLSYRRLGHEGYSDLSPVCRADHLALHALLEGAPAWRHLPRRQATDMIVAVLRDRIHTETGPADG